MIMDPIADMLTRIRNANALRYETVSMPYSKMKGEIAKILLAEGYISSFVSEGEGAEKALTLTLKYGAKGERVITNLKRISKPGLRITMECEKLPKVLKGLGIAIVSTSKGIMTDKAARKLNIGGEILAFVW